MSRTNLAHKTEPITAGEYLEFERAAKDKHEFIAAESLQWLARPTGTTSLLQMFFLKSEYN